MKPIRTFVVVFFLLFMSFIGVFSLYEIPSRTREVSFESDGLLLRGTLYLPREPSGSYIVLCHGNRRSGRKHHLYQRLAKELSQVHAVLSFDFRGFGESQPPSASNEDLDFSHDIMAAVRFLAERFEVGPEEVVLIGHSLGSLQVMRAGKKLKSETVIALGPGDLQKMFTQEARARRYYIDKIARNSGISLENSRLEKAISPITLASIFSSCGYNELHLVFGELEEKNLSHIRGYLDDYRKRCRGDQVVETVINDMDHMYRTEGKLKLGMLRDSTGVASLADRIRSILSQRQRLHRAES
jgi:pimeloyl-ACP methyl ester carboxylesterase